MFLNKYTLSKSINPIFYRRSANAVLMFPPSQVNGIVLAEAESITIHVAVSVDPIVEHNTFMAMWLQGITCLISAGIIAKPTVINLVANYRSIDTNRMSIPPTKHWY